MLTSAEIDELDAKAIAVGKYIGHDLRFVVAPNPEYVGLTCAGIFVTKPDSLTAMAAHDVDLVLTELAKGSKSILLDEDGDPRMFDTDSSDT